MSKINRLPDAELEIMNALWAAAAPLTAAGAESSVSSAASSAVVSSARYCACHPPGRSARRPRRIG